MAFDCAVCGYRSNEVKAGGGVPAQGQTFTLRVEGPEDLSRDVLKVTRGGAFAWGRQSYRYSGAWRERGGFGERIW